MRLAAVLIVRDEAVMLPHCLASLHGIVDDVHVHDTGSTDSTPELGIRNGALVTRGEWSGDFAAARNAALAGCDADWVLSIDADERVVADANALRRLLRRVPADVLTVDIDNASDEIPYTHRANRLFRPSMAMWSGRVHERVVGRRGTALRTRPVPRSTLRLDHVGYAAAPARQRKSLRNAELAQAALDELIPRGRVDELAPVLLDLGRSLAGAGRRQEAVNTYEALRELCPDTPEWIEATDQLARLLLAAGMDDVCLALTDELRGAGVDRSYCDWLAAQALAQLGDAERACTLLAGVREVVDTGGRRHDPAALRELTSLVNQLRHTLR